ncbi:MAG: UbiA family prenyltransferase [Candidatus Wallbacteria bacterium]|nr:UbiA family prenyltransferase [Candidatus Wallbacteria bacterium]
MKGLFGRAKLYAKMVQLEHTLFALPFSLGAMLLAAHGLPAPGTIGWILVALVSGRCFAMGMNRYADRHFDLLNPRTADRVLPGRQLGLTEVRLFLAGSAGLLVVATLFLPPLCLRLLPVALGLLTLYSYMKRFTAYAHFVLGLCLATAVAGSWIAVRGTLDGAICVLATSVVLWVAGFDILYAGQDIAFDREHGLHSLPARLGLERSQRVSRALHAASGAGIWATGLALGLGWGYFGGCLVITGLIAYEHVLVAGGDLSRINRAFFHINALVSTTFLAGVALEVFLGAW